MELTWLLPPLLGEQPLVDRVVWDRVQVLLGGHVYRTPVRPGIGRRIGFLAATSTQPSTDLDRLVNRRIYPSRLLAQRAP